jgi:flagellar protein FlaG
MADVSVASLILFIASIVLAAAVSGILIDSVGDVADAVGSKSEVVGEQIKTDIEIVSDPGSPVYDATSDTVTVYVKNTGLRTLDPEGVDVLVDGRYATVVTATPVESEWTVDGLLELEVQPPAPLTAGDHRLTVIVGSDTETFTFRL